MTKLMFAILSSVLLIFLLIIIRKRRYYKQFDIHNFDKLIGQLGNPVLIEAKLTELLPQAQKLSDNSVYVQMLTQIGLMQAVQKKFEQAHARLDQAQGACRTDDYVGQVRLLLERGRVFQQASDIEQAQKYFHASYELSKLHDLDYHTINAAHMIAIVEPELSDKMRWNKLALDLTLQTKDTKAAQWLAPLYNNLGQNYFDAQQYEKSLYHYQQALQLFEKDDRYSSANCIFSRWTIARCLRALGDVDKAFALQHELLSTIKILEHTKQYGMPEEMFFLVRGWIYEELAEVYSLENNQFEMQKYARLALLDLEHNEMFKTTSSDRIERLHNLLIA